MWLFVRWEDAAHVVNRISLRELAPRESLGRGVRERILLLVAPQLAMPRRVHDDRSPTESHLFGLARIDSSRCQV